MSRLADQLHAVNVVNTWDLLMKYGTKTNAIAVSYCPGYIRGDIPHTRVWSPHFKTDKLASWREQGKKHFYGNRATTFEQALNWASIEYGVTEWVTCPMDRSTKIPKCVLFKARCLLRHPKS